MVTAAHLIIALGLLRLASRKQVEARLLERAREKRRVLLLGELDAGANHRRAEARAALEEGERPADEKRQSTLEANQKQLKEQLEALETEVKAHYKRLEEKLNQILLAGNPTEAEPKAETRIAQTEPLATNELDA